MKTTTLKLTQRNDWIDAIAKDGHELTFCTVGFRVLTGFKGQPRKLTYSTRPFKGSIRIVYDDGRFVRGNNAYTVLARVRWFLGENNIKRVYVKVK